jgi:tetratricopeptide (TPR) repeat protein
MNQDFYRRVIEKNFPQLELPEDKDNFFKNFVALNSPKFPIYTNDFSQWEEGYFSPEGLLYRYYSSAQEIPSVKEIYQKNNLIWEKYHDPLKENSYGFEPVTLSAVRRNYYYSAMKLAQLFTEAKHWDEAIFYWEKAIYFEPKDLNLRLNLGEVYTKKGDCQRAEETLKKALADFSSPLPYLYLKENAAECWHDNVKKEEYEKLYQEKTKKPSKDYSR